ncbi:MAG: glycosyltransferase [Limnobacter sp.]|uniref:glycosyltransferase n=1 Tax=Limnobacter sp. TaxID=2003368 RepID=UPI00391B9164
MTRPKIAYLVNQYPKVSHTFIRREILALEQKGFEVFRLSVRGWDNPLADPVDHAERLKTHYLLQRGVLKLIRSAVAVAWQTPGRFLEALATALHLGRRADRPLLIHLVYLMEACLALEWLRSAKVQHVHAHFGANSTEVATLIHALGGPGYSFTVHGPEEFDKPEFIHLGDKIAQSRFVVAITSFCKSQLYRWIPHEQWQKVQVVHCGIEPQFHRPPLAEPEHPARLVCVGRLCEQKGQLLLLQACSVLKSRGVKFELVLAGDGEMRDIIERTITSENLQDSVRITGWISSEQVRDELLKARALVLPSFAEGLPIVLMEAMALKRPVISTLVAGIPELVEHGVHGFLAPAGDTLKLADLIEICLSMPEEDWRVMGQRAQDRVLKRHSLATETDKLAALFQSATHSQERT